MGESVHAAVQGGGNSESVHAEAVVPIATQQAEVFVSDRDRGGSCDLISTRKAQEICDHLKPQCQSAHILHTLMQRMTAACSELQAPNVLLELPATGSENFHREVLKFVSHLSGAGKTIVALIQPNLRKRIARSVWVERWNTLQNTPFRFKQTCSCRFGTQHHHTLFLGSTQLDSPEPCGEVADTGMSDEFRVHSLRQTAEQIAHSLRWDRPSADTRKVNLIRLVRGQKRPISLAGANLV